MIDIKTLTMEEKAFLFEQIVENFSGWLEDFFDAEAETEHFRKLQTATVEEIIAIVMRYGRAHPSASPLSSPGLIIKSRSIAQKLKVKFQIPHASEDELANLIGTRTYQEIGDFIFAAMHG